MICVVGGGVMGCTLTYRLAKRGLPVTLVEAGRIGQSGASSVPVALLNPYRGRSARATPFDLEALGSTWRLVEEVKSLGFETGVTRSGVLRIASNPKQAKTWRKRDVKDDEVRRLEPDEVPSGYHAPFGGFLALQGGWLEPRRWLRALAEVAQQEGATVLEGCDAQRLEAGAVHTSRGTVQASQVVLCSGPSLTLGQAEVALTHVAGEVIGLESSAPLPYPLAGAVYGAQSGGTFYLGGNHRPADQADASAPTRLQGAGSWFVPSLRGAQLQSVWHGVRAKTADNLPVVTELRPGLWFAGGLAGRGFLCAARVAEALTEKLTA